jgi:Uma2 family endonuclease
MVAQPKPPVLTVEEYLALEATSREKHEYVNGRLYAMAGGTNAHDRIGNNVRALINVHLGAGPCLLHGPDVRLRVNPTVYYYPDAFVTCDQDIEAAVTEFGAARLVVEVLSDSTEAADRGEKFANYQTLAAFEEYLLVDGRRRTVERFRRIADNGWLYRRYGDRDSITLETIDLTVAVGALYLASGL